MEPIQEYLHTVGWQYFSHLIQRADSLEKTLMLWGIGGRRRSGGQKMRWHHRLDGQEFESTLGVSDWQGGLACCDSWGCKESDTTAWLNWTELNNLSITSKLSISLANICFLYSLKILCISVMSVATYFSMSNFIEFNSLPFILDGSSKRSINFAYPLKEPAFRFIYFSSVTQLCLTICNPMDCSTPGFPVHHQLLELTQASVHRVRDVLQSSHPLFSPSPLTFNLSQHHGLFQWVNSSHQVVKVVSLISSVAFLISVACISTLIFDFFPSANFPFYLFLFLSLL